MEKIDPFCLSERSIFEMEKDDIQAQTEPIEVQETQLEATDTDPVPEPLPAEPTKAGFLGGSVVLKTSHMIIGSIVVLLLLVGGVALGSLLPGLLADPEIDPNAKDDDELYFDAGEVTPGNILAPGYKDVTFPAGKKDVQIILPNPEGNPCYFRYVLILKESGETVYRSGLIPPGKVITAITLSRPLEPGQYAMEIRVETFDLEERSSMNGITMDVNLSVR